MEQQQKHNKLISELLHKFRIASKYPSSFIFHPLKSIIMFLFKRLHLGFLISRRNFFSIPIYIISYNRLEYLRQIINWLEHYGYNNITIIDNASSYEPLLKFYETCGHEVIRMDKNYGHKVFYTSRRFFWKRLFSFYVLTDPDLAPVEGCPADFVEQFMKVMMKYPRYYKAGFSLKIDDIPDGYYLKHEVVAWESQFYEEPLDSSGHSYQIYKAILDTTFALNSPEIYHCVPLLRLKAVRTGAPYQLRHLPWYVTQRSDEEENYNRTIRSDITTWNGNFNKAQTREWMKTRIEAYEARNN